MKTLLLVLGFFVSLPSLIAGIMVDTVVVSSEEILTDRSPVTCEVQRMKDGSVTLKLSLKEDAKVEEGFESFDLRVLKAPLDSSEIKSKVRAGDLLARHQKSSKRTDSFVVTEEELPKSYVVAHWSLGPDSKTGMWKTRDVCFSVGALVDASPKNSTSR